MPTFAEMTERQKVYNDTIRALAEYRLAAAQAELTDAITQGVLVKIRIWETIHDQLKRDLRALRREENLARAKVEKLDDYARSASRLMGPDRPADYAKAARSFRQLYRYAITIGDIVAFDAPVTPGSLAAADFKDCVTNQISTKVPPATYDMADDIVTWMIEKKLVPYTNKARRVFRDIASAIDGIAEESKQSIKDFAKSIRDRTFDAWQPVAMFGIEPTPAEKRILDSAGGNQLPGPS